MIPSSSIEFSKPVQNSVRGEIRRRRTSETMTPRTPRSASKKLPFAKNNEFVRMNRNVIPKKQLKMPVKPQIETQLNDENRTDGNDGASSKFLSPEASFAEDLSEFEEVPVEQFKLSPKTQERVEKFKRERAAHYIQKWWHRHHKRRQLAEAALQRLLREAKNPIKIEPKPRQQKSPEPLVIEDDLSLEEDIGSLKEATIKDSDSVKTGDFMDISLEEKVSQLNISSPQVHLNDQLTKGTQINEENRTERWVKMVNDVDKLLNSEPDPQIYKLRRHSVFSLDTNLISRPSPQKSTLLKITRPLTASARKPRRKASDSVLDSSLGILNSSFVQSSQMAITEVTNQLLMQQRQLRDHEVVIERYKRELDQARELNLRHLRDTQKEFDARLEMQRSEYETTIQRNYKLIDELIAEKKNLHENCEKLAANLKTFSTKADDKIKRLTDDHGIQLKKLEAKMAAGEKIRREKWEKETTQQIKEMTIKGMEAQIARILSNHQQQMAQLKEQSNLQIKQADERAFSQYTQQVEDLRQNLMKEQEAHTTKELEAAKNRYERMMEEERASFEGNRRRIMLEREEERNHLEEMLGKCKSELIEVKKENEQIVAKLKYEHATKVEQLAKELDNRQKTQTEEIIKRTEEERKSWEEHNNAMYEAKMAARERDLRMQLKKERDQQIQSAISKLEMKVLEDERMIESQAESKIKRLTDRYENEIKQLEVSERSMSEKYTQVKAQNLELVTERDRLKVQLSQKEQQLQELDQVYEKLNKERSNLQDVIRQEFADRLVFLDSENKSLKNQLAESKAKISTDEDRHAKDVAKLRADNDAAMEQVRVKIRELSEKKENELSSLKARYQSEVDELESQLDSANRRVGHFEELLDEQRKQLLLLNQQGPDSTKRSSALK